MTATTPCYQHPRNVWMPACPECTAWHLPAARARRDELATAAVTSRVADRFAPRPDATHVPPAHLRLVA
jgi:hypothetical protein